MIQQINLYQIRKPKEIKFTFDNMLLIVAVFLSFLGIMTTFSAVKYFGATKELTKLTKEQVTKNEKLQLITGQVPKEKTRDEIITEIKSYEAEKQEKQEMLSLLSSAEIAGAKGFARYFETLANNAIQGVWLDRIHFKDNDNSISLEGKALQPEYVTKLIEKLVADPSFQGKAFQLFKLSLDEKAKQVEFILQTKPEPHPAEQKP